MVKLNAKYITKLSPRNEIYCVICLYIIVISTILSVYSFSFPIIKEQIKEYRPIYITVYGVIVGILITYIISKSMLIRQEKMGLKSEIELLTKKLHKLRFIISLLLRKDFVRNEHLSLYRKEFKHLSYFEYAKSNWVDYEYSPLLKSFFDNKNRTGAEVIYMQMHSFLENNQSVLDEYKENDICRLFPLNFVYNLMVHNPANVFYYYLDYEEYEYKEFINIDCLTEEEQQQVLQACLSINKEKYKNEKYGKNMLLKLGSEFQEYIIPRLYEIQEEYERPIPNYLNVTILTFRVLLIFGIIMPFISFIFDLIFLDIISISVLITLSIIIIFSISNFTNQEISIK